MTPKARQSRVLRKSRTRREDSALISSIRKIAAGEPPHGQVARAIKRWCSIWGVPALANTVSVRVNPRLRSSVARLVVADRCIELGPLFFSASINHREVLCHELAHAVAHFRYGGRIRPHGPEWREFICAVGFKPRAGHAGIGPLRSVAGQDRRTRRYEHRCIVCQSVWYARKRMTAWRCAGCAAVGLPGDLQIRVLNFRSEGAVR